MGVSQLDGEGDGDVDCDEDVNDEDVFTSSLASVPRVAADTLGIELMVRCVESGIL